MTAEMFLLIMAIGGIGILFGIVYPLTALLFYPVYRFLGGRKGIKKYMKGI